MTVSNFLMAISDAPWTALPAQFASISSDLQAIAIISGFFFVTHEAEECHVYRRHAKLEGFEMETKVLTKTMEDLTGRGKKKRDRHIGFDGNFKI